MMKVNGQYTSLCFLLLSLVTQKVFFYVQSHLIFKTTLWVKYGKFHLENL